VKSFKKSLKTISAYTSRDIVPLTSCLWVL